MSFNNLSEEQINQLWAYANPYEYIKKLQKDNPKIDSQLLVFDDEIDFDQEIFIDQDVCADFVCGICMTIADDCMMCIPKGTDDCGHLFCKNCLDIWKKTNAQKCPTCNAILDNVHSVKSNWHQRAIAALKVKCDECDWEGEFGKKGINYFTHVKKCPNKISTCKHCNKNIIKIDFEDHMKSCKKVEYQCKFRCFGCNFKGKKSHIKKHKREMLNYHMMLVIEIIRDKADELKKMGHENLVDEYLLTDWKMSIDRDLGNCPYVPIGCKFNNHDNIDSHENKNMKNHLKIACKYVSKLLTIYKKVNKTHFIEEMVAASWQKPVHATRKTYIAAIKKINVLPDHITIHLQYIDGDVEENAPLNYIADIVKEINDDEQEVKYAGTGEKRMLINYLCTIYPKQMINSIKIN